MSDKPKRASKERHDRLRQLDARERMSLAEDRFSGYLLFSLSGFGFSDLKAPVAFISPGGGELITIMLVLILLFGAKDAPRVFRSIQTFLDKLQRSAADFRYKMMYGDLHANTADEKPYDVEEKQETEDGIQEAGGREQVSEDSDQRTEDGGQKTEDGGRRADVRGRESEDGEQRTEDSDQRTGDGDQESGVRKQAGVEK